MLECGDESVMNNLFKRNATFHFKFLAFHQVPADFFHVKSVLQMYVRDQRARHNQRLHRTPHGGAGEPYTFIWLYRQIFLIVVSE